MTRENDMQLYKCNIAGNLLTVTIITLNSAAVSSPSLQTNEICGPHMGCLQMSLERVFIC